MNEYELIGRLADLDKRLRVIEGQSTAAVQPVPEPQPQPEFTVPATLPHQLNSGWIDTKLPPEPQPQTLVEAMEELMEAMPKRIDGCCSTILNNAINNFHIASAREKKRSELVEKVIAGTRCFVNFGGAHCGLAGVKIAINKLDTFDNPQQRR